MCVSGSRPLQSFFFSFSFAYNFKHRRCNYVVSCRMTVDFRSRWNIFFLFCSETHWIMNVFVQNVSGTQSKRKFCSNNKTPQMIYQIEIFDYYICVAWFYCLFQLSTKCTFFWSKIYQFAYNFEKICQFNLLVDEF